MMRAAVSAGESRDVLALEELRAPGGCREFLEMLLKWGEEARWSKAEEDVLTGECAKLRRVRLDDLAPVRVLTWNIDGLGKSCAAPECFSVEDKLAAVQLEIGRWKADVVALQECPSSACLQGLQGVYDLVGSVAAHRGFVHLYARKGSVRKRSLVEAGVPGVFGEVEVSGQVLSVAAVHLAPGDEGAGARLKAMKKVMARMRERAALIMGDTNMREVEVEEMLECSQGRFGEASYAGQSWDMRRNQYFEEYKGMGRKAPALSFDRVFFGGQAMASACLVGQGRCFREGESFCLSDHFGVLGFVDAHAVHEVAAVGEESGDKEERVEERARRRAALAGVRDQACVEEQFVVQAMCREGRENAAVQRAQGDARRREELLKQSRAAQQARRAAQQSLWEDVFGQESLFAAGRERVYEELGEAPSPSQDVAIEAYEGLIGSDANAVWRGGYPFLSGFVNRGNACFAISVAQVLLRVPAVAVLNDPGRIG